MKAIAAVVLLIAHVALAGPPELLGAVQLPVPGAPGQLLTIRKIKSGDVVALAGRDAAGKLTWLGPILGSADHPVVVRGRPVSLELVDVTGDGQPEVLAAAFVGPRASHLYVMRYKDGKDWLEPIPCEQGPEHAVRDVIVSDAERGEDLVVQANGTVEALGLDYSAGAAGPPPVARFRYAYRDGRYHFNGREPLKER
jgi:hypothetical protein